MKRFVVKSDDGALAIMSTSGFEPVGAICECKDEWTIHTIRLDAATGLVIYDPEKMELERAAREKQEAWDRKKEHVKVVFIEHVHSIESLIKTHWKTALVFAIGIAIGIVCAMVGSLTGSLA